MQEPISNSCLPLLQETGDAQRAFRRFPMNLAVNISLCGTKTLARCAASAKYPATLTNASVSGLCFSSLEQFPEGTLVVVELEMYRQIHRIPVVVRRCAPRKNLGRTFYECGTQFVKSEATLLFVPLMARYLRLRASGF